MHVAGPQTVQFQNLRVPIVAFGVNAGVLL